MTDRAKELIARVHELDKAATPGPWEDHGSPSDDEPYIQLTHCRLIISGDNEPGMWDDWQFVQQSRTALPDLTTLAEQAIARADAVRRILQTWDTPTDMDLETLAKAIKARVAELEEINVQNKNQIAELLEEMDDRAEKAEADLAEARRMLKEADAVIARHVAHLRSQYPEIEAAIARHQAREGK